MRRLLCIALALVGCGAPRLHGIEGGLAVSASALHFPLTYRGYPTQTSLSLTNTSPARIQVAVAIALPFQSLSTLELAGGESKTLTLTFDPTTSGTFTAPVTLTSGSTHLDVQLDGEAREPTSCPATPCHHARFNPTDGTCITESDADGASCFSSDACLTNATCRAGVCVGTEVSCDDHNACTADACSATGGCVHVDQTASCPAPSDPCKVAACDPGSGCGVAHAPDGTVCGSVDCATAHACFMGSCRAVTPPDGFECSPASPCQAHSTCQGGSCVPGAVTEMVPEWSVPAGAWGTRLMANAQGDLFWVENGNRQPDGGFGMDLVSMTPEGFPRFRVSFPDGVVMLVGDLVVIAENGFVSALHQTDGQVAWQTPEATFDPSPEAKGAPYSVLAMQITTHGLIASSWQGVRGTNARVTLTDPTSGSMVTSVDLDGSIASSTSCSRTQQAKSGLPSAWIGRWTAP